MKKTVFALVSFIILFSCNENSDNDMNLQKSPSVLGSNQSLKIEFSKILAQAVFHSVDIRNFLKNESLKQFDKDYDVLYYQIRNEKININEVFRDKLLEFASSEQVLIDVEEMLPLVTIFVPELPVFSAEKWNTQNDIPVIAVLEEGSDEIIAYNHLGEKLLIKFGDIPSFPVLVVKINERVISNHSDSKLNTGKSNGRLLYDDSKVQFSFLDEAFDPSFIKKQIAGRTGSVSSDIDQVNIDAYYSGTPWHRDYVYYGLTPTNTTGEFRSNYSEFITSFKFLDGEGALTAMSDQSGDPKLIRKKFAPGNPTWFEGRFEFRITVLINSQNGLGSEINKVLSVKPEDLFEITYTRLGLWYNVTKVTPKEYKPNVELVPWSLQDYGSSWKFIVYEYDPSETITKTNQVTSTFAANFSVEGTVKKIGLKFGASATTSKTTTFTVTTTLASDFLGEATLSFDQPVITSIVGSNFTTREITTGNLLTMSIEPKRPY